jgi:hypothetical protein
LGATTAFLKSPGECTQISNPFQLPDGLGTAGSIAAKRLRYKYETYKADMLQVENKTWYVKIN